MSDTATEETIEDVKAPAKTKANGKAKKADKAAKANGKAKSKKATGKADKPGKAAKTAKGEGKAKKADKAKAEKPAKKAKEPKAEKPKVKRDKFGFKEGSLRSRAAAMYSAKKTKGATLNEVKEELNSSQLNLLKELEEKGFTVTKTKQPAKEGKKAVTRYFIKT